MNLELIHKYLADECSEEQRKQLEDWVQKNEENRKLFRSIKRIWEVSPKSDYPADQDFDVEMDDEWSILEKKISSPHSTSAGKPGSQYHSLQDKKRILKKSLYYAAALIFLVVCGSWMLSSLYVNVPGKPNSEEIASEKNQVTRFRMSDGTQVTLNSGSRIKVPEKFSGENRQVELEGEAFFDVASDSLHPFVVDVNGAKIKVLGTQFNLKAEATSNEVQVAVFEGKVRLQNDNPKSNQGITLTKGNFANYNLQTKDFIIEKTAVANYRSWMTRRLIFKNNTLADVSRQLERLYDVDIHFGNNQLKSRKLSINFEKRDLPSVLDIISTTLDITYRLNANQAVWFKKGE